MIAIQSQGTEPGANSTRYDEKELYLFQVNYKCLRTPCFDSIEGSDALGHEEDLLAVAVLGLLTAVVELIRALVEP